MVACSLPRPTYRRWEAAITRAIAESIAVLADDGHRALVTASNQRDAYLIVGSRCGCPAGAKGDTCCKHLAALHLSREMTDPEPPAAPAVCGECRGHGEIRRQSAMFAGVTYRVECPACRAARLAA